MRSTALAILFTFFVAAINTGCASTPLNYADMTEIQVQDEKDLQQRIERTAQPIARIGMQFVDADKRGKLAAQIVELLESIERTLVSTDASGWQRELISQTAKHLTLLTPDIQEVAKDAFDLFNGWVNLPGLNDIIPDVIRDRLLAFIRGAVAGLKSVQTEG